MDSNDHNEKVASFVAHSVAFATTKINGVVRAVPAFLLFADTASRPAAAVSFCCKGCFHPVVYHVLITTDAALIDRYRRL